MRNEPSEPGLQDEALLTAVTMQPEARLCGTK